MSEMTQAVRPWCGEAVYPGLEPFALGTIIMPHDAQHHEIEAALHRHALTFLPDGFEIIRPVCGALFFNAEEADQ